MSFPLKKNYIFFRSGAPPMTLLTAMSRVIGALTDPHQPTTASNGCTTDVRRGGIGRVPHQPKILATPVYWRTVVSSWNSEGKEVDGDHRETAYRSGVSSHHFSSTYTQTTSLFTRARVDLCMHTTLLSLHRARTLQRSMKP